MGEPVWKYAGNELMVMMDMEAKCLKISTMVEIVPGWKPVRRKVLGIFTSEEDWAKSPFFNQITNQDIQDEIVWFWLDIEFAIKREPCVH